MRIHQSLTFRLLLFICAALLVLVLVLLSVTNHQVRSILDQSQMELYQRQIDSILNNLQLQDERMRTTGVSAAERDNFRTSTIHNLRATYYPRNDQQTVPVIFTLEGTVIMHPTLTTGSSFKGYGWDVERVRQMQNGQFVHNHNDVGDEWHIFKLFGPWNWVVGYSIPVAVKYADATKLIRYLALAFFIGVIPVGLILSIYIRRQLTPIHELTKAAQLMGTGDLKHPLPVDQPGEIGTLAQSFAHMRDQIRTELGNRNRRVERGQRQQQALVALSNTNPTQEGDPTSYLRFASEQLGLALDCSRISIWNYDGEQAEFRCQNQYLTGQGHSQDESHFLNEDYPVYFTSILGGQVFVADDVHHDPRICDSIASNLFPKQTQSLLAVPIRVAGRTRGVVHIENTREKHQWHKDEITFVSAVAEQIAQNIIQTEGHTAQREIIRLRQELANIVDSMPSILIGIDQSLIVRHWNREAKKITGIDEDNVRGKLVTHCLEQLIPHKTMIQTALAEHRLQTRRKLSWHINSRQIFVDLTIYPLLNEEESGAVIRIDDVSERVQLEEMMVQTEKMLSVGGLAAGMAHEINNPLAGIMQNIQVIRNRFSSELVKNAVIARECGTEIEIISRYIEKRGMQPMFQALTESSNRAARIVDNMLSFSRKSESEQTPHSLKELIDRTLDLAANDYDLKKNYDFRKVLITREDDKDLPEVPCTATEIQQVLLNLLKNGAQAMSDDPDCAAPQFTLRTRRDDRFALIEIEDNGPGIPEDVRRRIFEPFFTTKGIGVGTGLGLSVSYFIIREKHGGSMEVSSIPGQGTLFSIRLPITDKAGSSV